MNEDFAAEAEKVLADQQAIVAEREALFPKDVHDPHFMIPWYAKRIEILNNNDYHLVARLSFSRSYDSTVSDYIEKLKLAAFGDKDARLRVEEIKVKALNLISFELSRLRVNADYWRKKQKTIDRAGLGKWLELKRKVNVEWNQEHNLLEVSTPKDTKDMSQWRAYYQTRVARLELDSLIPVARLVWVTKINLVERDNLVKGYIDLLNQIILGHPVEEQLHRLEARIEAVVLGEAARIRQSYPEFFPSEVPSGQGGI
ncbi:hypothetical protein KY309_01515 [Candidatus Woesearchaeota archaeon]|nr:hypothetical protein [Candidatus Woesearchaeota archaeon]MBW3016267.1 hypothetical protein [Candidatus Woesearchaeota archaeon]